jgi:5'-nucleotidase
VKILLTNDDGPSSTTLAPTVELLESLGHEVVVVLPEKQRSATGLARTYHKPLRVKRAGGYYLVNGFPADAVFLGLKLLARDADLVISGVNIGENIGFESIYGSGTVAAALQAGVLGYKAIALSAEAGASLDLTLGVLRAAVEASEEWPPDLLAVSINVPATWRGSIEAARRPATHVFLEELHNFIDPKGEPFYWRWGPRGDGFREDSDAYYFYVERAIVVMGLCATGVCAPGRFVESFKSAFKRAGLIGKRA